MTDTHRLSCHCGTVKLQVQAELRGLLQCNCSTCRRFGAVHWYVPADSVTLTEHKIGLAHYSCRAVHEGHHFCPTCGASVMRTGHPNGVVALNACLVEGVDVFELDVERFDGRTKIPPGVLP